MPAAEVLAEVETALRDHFAQQPVRATVSFVGVDPIEILRFEPIPGERAYVSLGMSRHPMTAPAAELVDPTGPRAELMLHLRDPLDQHEQVWRRLAVLAAAPAVEGVVYVDGMTVDLGEPLVPGSSCTGALISGSSVDPVPTPSGPVSILQATPATSGELAWCRVRGAAELSRVWAEQSTDLLDLTRSQATLG